MTNILTRRSSLGFSHSLLSKSQLEMDAITSNFIEGASDWRSLVAMSVGGLAYRATKLGVMSVGAPLAAPLLTRFLSPVFGLISEVTVYRGVSGILSCRGEPMCSPGQTQESAPTGNSWSTDFINFASLKVFGLAAHNTNLVLSHAIQDVGVLVGHHLAYGLSLATRPEGSITEQLLHAEIMNMQMQAGMSLGGMLTGNRLQMFEQSLESIDHEVPLKNQVNFKTLNPFPFRASSEEEVFGHELISRTLEVVSGLPPFNIAVPRLRAPGDYPGRKGGSSQAAVEALERMKGTSLVYMDKENPHYAFQSLYRLLKQPGSIEEGVLALRAGERIIGYQKFNLKKEANVCKLTFMYVWVDEVFRGNSYRDQLQKNILAATLLALRKRNEALEMIFHQVRNPYNVDRYLAAGLECIEEEPSSVFPEDDFVYTWGAPSPGSFVALSAPPDPAYRIRFPGQMLNGLGIPPHNF